MGQTNRKLRELDSDDLINKVLNGIHNSLGIYNLIVSDFIDDAKANLGDGYRLLEFGESIEDTDERYAPFDKSWHRQSFYEFYGVKKVGTTNDTSAIYRRKIKVKSEKLNGLELIKAAVANAAKLYEDPYVTFRVFKDGSGGLYNEDFDMLIKFPDKKFKRSLRQIAAAESVSDIELIERH